MGAHSYGEGNATSGSKMRSLFPLTYPASNL